MPKYVALTRLSPREGGNDIERGQVVNLKRNDAEWQTLVKGGFVAEEGSAPAKTASADLEAGLQAERDEVARQEASRAAAEAANKAQKEA